MQRRYSHYLQKAAGSKWPGLIVAVDCSSRAVLSTTGVACSNLELHTWSYHTLEMSGKTYKITARHTGHESGIFWSSMHTLSELFGNVWLVSYDCNRVWSLLQLWEEIENGKLRFEKPDKKDRSRAPCDVRPVRQAPMNSALGTSAGSVSRLLQQGGGYLIAEGPPSACRLRLPTSNRWLTWIDLQNFGLNSTHVATLEHPYTSWIADVMIRMSSELHVCNLGSLRTTAGAQAMHGWRCQLPEAPIYCTSKPSTLAHESDSYIGGRCEAYHIGDVDEPLAHLDFRSMYPSVCIDHELPVMIDQEFEQTIFDEYTPPSLLKRSIGRVLLRTDEPAYPLRRNGDVIYPVGKFRTTLVGPELYDAYKNGHIIHCEKLTTYKMHHALTLWATRVYSMREQADLDGDVEMAAVAKRLLVSLPGKLGQRELSWVDAYKTDTDPPYGEWFGKGPDGKAIRYRAIAGHVQHAHKGGFTPDAVPAMASFITSYGRMMLLSAIRTAKWENVFYVDTDSLFVNGTGLRLLLESGFVATRTLGMLRIVSDDVRLNICGIKHYVANNKTVCAGLKTGVVTDNAGVATWQRSATPWEHARAGVRPVAETVTQQLTFRAAYHHGTVTETGRVKPLVIFQE